MCQKEKEMRRTCIIPFVLTILVYSCQNRQVNKSLAMVDSLVAEELYDSAYNLVRSVDGERISNQKDLAHYNLLKVQTGYLTNNPFLNSDSILDLVISYYEQYPNKEKLSDAYYYKAVGANAKGNYQQSILLYKQAEQYAEKGNYMCQQYKIAEGITYVNALCANYDTQLLYARKTLELSGKIGNRRWLAYSYYWMGLAFSNIGNIDSVAYYFRQIEPYIKDVNDKELPFFLSSIGYILRTSNPKVAKKYLLESLSYKEQAATYEYLAEIAYDEGNSEEAYSYWKKALKVQDGNRKDNVLHNIIEYDMERGKTDSICERINEIIAIRDSIDAKLKNDTIKDLQTRFDHEVEMREKDRAVIKWQWVAIALVILLLVGVIYYLVRKYQNRIQLQKYQMQIHDYMEQIRALSGKKDQEAEIDRLNKEIKKIMDEKSPRLAQGRILYDKVVANENMGKWRLDDVEKFIEYYTATNYRVVNRLQSIHRRDELTPHRLLYLILVEMKKTDQQICFIQGITKECLRVYRFRTQPIEKEETSEELDESL